MNHDIVLELYEIAQEWSYEKYSKRETGYTREYWASYKLAELIVRECANYIRENYDSWDAEPLAHNLEVDFGLHGDYAE